MMGSGVDVLASLDEHGQAQEGSQLARPPSNIKDVRATVSGSLSSGSLCGPSSSLYRVNVYCRNLPLSITIGVKFPGNGVNV